MTKDNKDKEIDSLKEEIKDLKKKKELEKLQSEVNSLKNGNETISASPSQYSDPSWDAIKSKKTTAGLLGIFFGFLGVHKFILGYQKEGFILLGISVIGGIITCGAAIIVTDIIGIIEGIIILTKSPEEFKRLYLDKKTDWF
tara:strand:- start:149 stop:574 length:426 start_codon:yes stop_codon:yes gene_type:complete